MKPRELHRIFRQNQSRNVRVNSSLRVAQQQKGLAMGQNNSNPNLMQLNNAAILRISLELNTVTGATAIKVNQPITAAKLISILAQTINANANVLIQQESMLIDPKKSVPVQIPPHDFTGDNAGICTVCGKLENAHNAQVQ